MAWGDVGGTVTELVITCRTPENGAVNIAKGDALKLIGAFTINNAASPEDAVFGQAMVPSKVNNAAIPVKVRGISAFNYTGVTPVVDGVTGITASATAGKVKTPFAGTGKGIVVKVDEINHIVHVLM